MLNFVFLTTWLSTTSLNFFNFIVTVFHSSRLKLSTSIVRLFKLDGTLISLAMFSLSTSVSTAINPFLAAESEISTPG